MVRCTILWQHEQKCRGACHDQHSQPYWQVTVTDSPDFALDLHSQQVRSTAHAATNTRVADAGNTRGPHPAESQAMHHNAAFEALSSAHSGSLQCQHVQEDSTQAAAQALPADIAGVMCRHLYTREYMESIQPTHLPPREVCRWMLAAYLHSQMMHETYCSLATSITCLWWRRLCQSVVQAAVATSASVAMQSLVPLCVYMVQCSLQCACWPPVARILQPHLAVFAVALPVALVFLCGRPFKTSRVDPVLAWLTTAACATDATGIWPCVSCARCVTPGSVTVG